MNRFNVLYIHTHDSGRVFSPYGYTVQTPALEAFAKDAVLFSNAFCAAPTCSPSRSALLTGTYPHQNGMLGLSNRGFQLNDYSCHAAGIFKQNGYHTALCGIQHEAAHYNAHAQGAQIIGYDEDLTTNTELKHVHEKHEWDSENVDNTVSWLQNYSKKTPFFLSFGFFAAHRPYQNSNENPALLDCPPCGLPKTESVLKDFAGYAQAIHNVDTGFEKIIAALKEKKLYDNTIIIFTTDHGLAVPFSKSTLYDAGLAIALIIRVPHSKGLNKTSNSLISHIDILPTLQELLALTITHKMEGISFAAHLLKKEEDSPLRDEIFAEMNFHTSYEPARCIRTNRYKYIEYLDTTYTGQNLSNINESIVKEFFLSIGGEQIPKPRKQLYDLFFDPTEKLNLAGSKDYATIEDQLKTSLDSWRKKTKDPLYNGSITWKKGWIVNKPTCRIQGSKLEEDFVEGYGQ